jgi:hypothetical protein
MIKVIKPATVPHVDPVVERYMRDVDRTLLRRNLSLTPQQRLEQLQRLQLLADELQRVKAKVAAGRPKDLEAIAELRTLLQERGREE